MGKGPNLKKAMATSADAEKDVNDSIKQAEKELENTEAKATDYINKHTKGIIEIAASNNESHSKFSDEYSLEMLDKVVDGISKTAQNLVAPKDNSTKAIEAIGDVGEVVKSTLALFSTSSSTNKEVQVIFTHIISGDENFAVYFACNSMSAKGKNSFGNKEITVVANMYILARVNPNKEITRAKILQHDLDTLEQLNIQFDDALLKATTEKDLQGLKLAQDKINLLKEKYEKDLTKLRMLGQA